MAANFNEFYIALHHSAPGVGGHGSLRHDPTGRPAAPPGAVQGAARSVASREEAGGSLQPSSQAQLAAAEGGCREGALGREQLGRGRDTARVPQPYRVYSLRGEIKKKWT